jgi:hypothetical protein
LNNQKKLFHFVEDTKTSLNVLNVPKDISYSLVINVLPIKSFKIVRFMMVLLLKQFVVDVLRLIIWPLILILAKPELPLISVKNLKSLKMLARNVKTQTFNIY